MELFFLSADKESQKSLRRCVADHLRCGCLYLFSTFGCSRFAFIVIYCDDIQRIGFWPLASLWVKGSVGFWLRRWDTGYTGRTPSFLNMRIAMFSWESLHSIAVGGVAPHVTELAAALQRRNHEVHVFTRRGEGQQIHEEKRRKKD